MVTAKRRLLEQKLSAVNQSLKERIPNREVWLRSKLYDELHMQQWLFAVLYDGVQPSGTRMLDVGAGYGGFALAASWYGFQVTALESNPLLAEIASLRAECFDAAINVVCREAEEFRPPDRFEIITLWNVLEHVRDPAGFLSAVKNWLSPGGTVYLNVMNRYSLIDPHVHLLGVNFLPPPLRELYVRMRRREASFGTPYEMRLGRLHYFTPRQFESLCARQSLAPRRIRFYAGLREALRPSFVYALASP